MNHRVAGVFCLRIVMSNNYEIRDLGLAPSGHRKIEWVKNNMPVLAIYEKIINNY